MALNTTEATTREMHNTLRLIEVSEIYTVIYWALRLAEKARTSLLLNF
jgi:hypothetical protein